MTSILTQIALPVAAGIALIGGASAVASDPPGRVVRWVEGSYDYRRLSDGGMRGRETFRMSLHSDGTRVMRATTDIFSRGVQVSVIQRVAPSFRPLDAQVSMYLPGGFKGTGTFLVDANRLTAVVRGAKGVVTAEYEVPDAVSIGSHPLVLDGWHTWYARPEIGVVQAGTIFLVDGDPDVAKPMLGKIKATTIEYKGDANVDVPAGSFRAQHYRIDDQADVWIATEDRILVRSVWPRFGSEYVLQTLRRSDAEIANNQKGE